MKKYTKSYLVVDKSDFSKKINSRMTIGKEMLSRQITSHEALEILKNDISKWSDYNMELLKQSFDNPDNEYLNDYKSSYKHFGFLGVHTLDIDFETQKKKMSGYITGLEKIINKIDLIPIKGTA
jgi:hypothetical protein